MRRVILILIAGPMLLAAGGREAPEDVALAYARAVYARDAGTAYRLISAEDRRVKDEATFRLQHEPLRGFVRDVVQQLASFIAATPVDKTIAGRRATVTLDFRVPDVNARELRALLHGWDEQRLERLPEPGHRRIKERLAELHRSGTLPTLDGEETLELVKEDSGWRVFLNWAGGVRLRFASSVQSGMRLRTTVSPEQIVIMPGDRVRVTIRATNLAPGDLTTRVGHRIEPKGAATSLALLQCPLFIPTSLKPGETKEFVSEYLLLKDVPDDAKQFEVTYEFRPGGQ